MLHRCCIVLPFLRRQVAIQTDYRNLMPFGLDMAVVVCGLADAGVAHLLLDPPQVRSVAKEPSGVCVAGRMVLAIGQACLGQKGLPYSLKKVAVANDSASARWEHDGPLVRRPFFDLALQLYCSQVLTEGCQQRRAGLHPSVLAILTGLDPPALLRPRPLNVNASARPIN